MTNSPWPSNERPERPPAAPPLGTVIFVGAGPGAPDLLTVRAAQVIAAADLIVYAGSLVPPEVLAMAKPKARLVDSAPLTLEETHALMAKAARAGQLVARVHTGDPSLYGTVPEQARLLDAEGIPWEIVPGVSAAFAAAAAAKVAFTLPQGPQTLVLTRLPGRTPIPKTEDLTSFARTGASLAVYLSGDKTKLLAAKLQNAGLAPSTPILIAQRIGHPDETITSIPLAHLADLILTDARQTLFLVLPGQERPTTARSCLYHPGFSHGSRPGPHAAPAAAPLAPLAVYAFCLHGIATAQRLAQALPATVFVPHRLEGPGTTGFSDLGQQMAHTWGAFAGHIFIGATGLAVRAIAPHLRHKTKDPAVVVCDASGSVAISLLSGHLGGANALTRQVAEILGASPIITTASDCLNVPALDLLAQESGLCLGNPEALARLQGAWLEGTPIRLWDPEGWLQVPPEAQELLQPALSPDIAQVIVSPERPQPPALFLHPPCLAVGIGCRRGASAQAIQAAIKATLTHHNLAPAAVAVLASIETKKDEPGLLQAARQLGLPVRWLPSATLAAQTVPHPSPRVLHHMGVPSVCEAAALSLHPQAVLRVPKTIHGPVTVAVAQLPSGWWALGPETVGCCPPSPGRPLPAPEA